MLLNLQNLIVSSWHIDFFMQISKILNTNKPNQSYLFVKKLTYTVITVKKKFIN